MSGLSVPVLSVVIGEGGSGGGLALAVVDEVWMMENAIYSMLSPEGFATIIYKDSKRAKDAANVMKLTAKDLKELGMVEKVFKEEELLTRENLWDIIPVLDNEILKFLNQYSIYSKEELLEKRYQRFRQM